jgi:phosphoesterase RecJ-like protein
MERTRSELSDVLAALRRAPSFLVTTHISPDGDAIGSMLGVYHLLKALGKTQIVCACEDPVPRIYQWIPGAEHVVNCQSPGLPAEVVVLVDVSRQERLGRAANLIQPGATLVVIDHHVEENPCGHVNFLDTRYAAVGEIVVELFGLAEIPLTPDAAVCAYVALATDTGSFRYSNTTPRSHAIAATLLKAGIDVAGIASRIFDTMSPPKFRLLQRVLERTQFVEDGRIAYSHVTTRDMDETGAQAEDMDGLINFARSVEGVQVAAFFREIDPKCTRVSLRTCSSVNAAAAMQHFGGGGHAAAAGSTVNMPLSAAQASVLSYIRTLMAGTT